ncbi:MULTISPECIES: hypothetical protein [Arthrobacter]|uniref:Uncharacterized protein n=1 Tax=Arthrobacter psychrochitiniphilus TaxID=291045 RepID=A0A2V3DVB5_9MICC|nr:MULTISPECIES: hypothetical protein [Arthrobacter]NYG18748.1 hypothetical protein [Arthrobacter psychrochitiniphilus]PXA66327.1 hypothetical protein CVS29_06450 [Arthrobacter psychrochitiniphilus]
MIAGSAHAGVKPSSGSDWIGVVLLLLLLGGLGLFFVLGLRELIKEAKAARLRNQRGLPRPTE